MASITRSFKIGDPVNELHFGISILKEMRAAGAPLLGGLWPQGAEYGTLTVTSDALEGELTYQWSDDAS